MARAFAKHFDEGLVRRWVKALRSGRYKRYEGSLSSSWNQEQGSPNEKNCCLGVACRVARMPSEKGKYNWRGWGMLHEFERGNELRKRLGLTRALERRLANRNDAGASFAKIADLIEAELL